MNLGGNRRLNHAHMAAVTQIRNDTPGRAYYRRKLSEGKTKKEALRCLKRYIAREVFGLIRKRHRQINQAQITP